MERFVVHAGNNDFGEHRDTYSHRGHLFDKPDQRHAPFFSLPFVHFYAPDKESAEEFIDQVNFLMAKFDIPTEEASALINRYSEHVQKASD